MNSRVTLVAVIYAAIQSFGVEGLGLVEMISDYAKVIKNPGTPAKIIANNDSASTILPSETSPEPVLDYQDFDDFEEDRSLKQPTSSETLMKYFNGLISLLALMYKVNGSYGSAKSPKQSENHGEPRSELKKFQKTEKKFQVAQDRFEFPQKKFKYHANQINDNTIDQQYQPVENYPPYNPLKANAAETYNKDDKKTSYGADLTQYDLNKHSASDYSHDVEVQQSYSYEIPYENPKPVKSPGFSDDEISWTDHNVNPVYHSWMTKTPTENKPANDVDSYQIYITKAPSEDKPIHVEDFKPWKNKTPEMKPQVETELRQPWNEKPHDFPVYHHDFENSPPSDHHFEYHEVEHSMDEDRVSKKPYSYYFLGRKLWYVPLLFSVYFIIYIGALVLKSVARHKIQFPEKIWNLHDDHYGKHRRHRKIDDITENYENAVNSMKNKFM